MVDLNLVKSKEWDAFRRWLRGSLAILDYIFLTIWEILYRQIRNYKKFSHLHQMIYAWMELSKIGLRLAIKITTEKCIAHCLDAWDFALEFQYQLPGSLIAQMEMVIFLISYFYGRTQPHVQYSHMYICMHSFFFRNFVNFLRNIGCVFIAIHIQKTRGVPRSVNKM